MLRIIELDKKIAPHFYDIAQDIILHRHTDYWIDGGRGSTKSSFISLMIVYLLLKYPNMHAAAMRKVGKTLRDSVFAQILWALEELGVSEKFRVTHQPMEITRISTGQKIYFRGADDPVKMKSIKPKFGYIGVAWYEELDQFYGMEEIRNINQSIVRGGEYFWLFYSFNPPKSRDNWVNVEKMEKAEGRICHHSNYLGVPREWLGNQFFAFAEDLRRRNAQAYEHEYLGIATGTGGAVFENIMERRITDEEISRMQYFRYGLDFGFSVDPLAWLKMSYDRKHNTLYLLDEIYGPKIKNKEAVARIKKKGTDGMRILADSEDPRTIADMREYGLVVDSCKKGPGSIEHGIKWLQDLDAIVVDKSRTPNAYREFTLYEYERNRNGEYISSYPDRNNHTIDAARYGLEPDMLNNGWGFGFQSF